MATGYSFGALVASHEEAQADITNLQSNKADKTTQVIAGNGLTGGGTLGANRTLTVGAGSGISVAATTVAVDSTVIRTTGNQTLGGIKTFTSPIVTKDATAATHAPTLGQLQTSKALTGEAV